MPANDPVKILVPRSAVGPLWREISRRRFLSLGALAGSAAFLAACGGGGGDGDSAGGDGSATGGELEDSLSIYSWGDYDDPDLLSQFTSDLGPKITMDSFGSNEELVGKLTAAKGTSGFDIVVPTGPYIPQMVANGLLLKLNKDLIPNLAHMDPAYLGRGWDPTNDYSICKAWGTTGFCYDKTVITRDLKDWNDFFDAAQNEASGKTALLDDGPDITGMYFWANGINWNTEDEDAMNAAEDFLVNEIAPHIAAFNSYPGSDGSIPQSVYALMQIWNGDARQGILESSDPDKWQWVLPTPATELWMDNWSISAGAPHPEAAHAFIDFILEPENQIINTDYIGYHTGAKDIEQTARDEGFEMLDLIFFDDEQLATMEDGEINNALERKIDIYNKVKAAASA